MSLMDRERDALLAEWIAKGNAAAVDEQFDDAIEFFREALLLAPQNSDVLARRSAVFLRRAAEGDAWSALQDAVDALSFDAKHARAQERKADALANLKEFEMALQAFSLLESSIENER